MASNLEKYLKVPRRVVDKSANYLKKKADSFTLGVVVVFP